MDGHHEAVLVFVCDVRRSYVWSREERRVVGNDVTTGLSVKLLEVRTPDCIDCALCLLLMESGELLVLPDVLGDFF
jgi:hypothetical protein